MLLEEEPVCADCSEGWCARCYDFAIEKNVVVLTPEQGEAFDRMLSDDCPPTPALVALMGSD